MDEMVRGLAQLGAAGIMSAVIVLVMWYLLTKMIPKMQDKHDAVVDGLVKRQNESLEEQRTAYHESITSQREAFMKALADTETRRVKDDERCERRHTELMQGMERLAVKQEEMSFALDLLHGPQQRRRGPGTKENPLL